MSDVLFRLGHDLIEAAQGPLQFRVLMQAVVAVGFGATDGLRDARLGLPVDDPLHRRVLLRELGVSLGKVLLAVLAMDVACQAIVLGFHRVGLGVALALLAGLPSYLAVRAGLAWLALRPQRRASRRTP